MADAAEKRAWDLMESISFCMLSTWNGTELRSRPMGAFILRHEGVICFLTDVRAHKDEEIQQFPQVCLGFSDPRRQKYVSVSGTAQITSDRKKIEELWSVPAKLWWDTPGDRNLRAITVAPKIAEYWDAPGNFISNLKAAFSILTGKQLKHGDHQRIEF